MPRDAQACRNTTTCEAIRRTVRRQADLGRVVPSGSMGQALIEIRNLVTTFTTGGQRLVAVDDVSLSIPHGQTLALVGESGCGKSVTALSILRLLPDPPARIERGQILFEDRDLLRLSESEIRRVRGDRIAMIFQEPMTSLNPVFTIGYQLVEAIRLHRDSSPKQALERALELLNLVGIPSPSERIRDFPHQLSGGMRQRVMIAMALCCDPKLLIADEPTTALDVTVQAQILDLLAQLQARLGMSILFITHDLGIVAEFAERVAVMYAGRIVEESSVLDLFRSPTHPYSQGLLASIPAHVLARQDGEMPARLPTIEGVVPSLANLPSGCRFRDRCNRHKQLGAEARGCIDAEPELAELADGRRTRCHFPLTSALP
jgi:oligopeptide/dipeptide ABC transporter ATP-binding protein